MYNGPEAGTDSTEFIEFYNNDTLIADLANYYFTQGVTHTFTEGIILPGEYFTIAVNQSGFFNSFGVQADAIWTSGGLSNGGEDITLKDVFNNTVDSVNYDDIAPWPTDGDGFISLFFMIQIEMVMTEQTGPDPIHSLEILSMVML